MKTKILFVLFVLVSTTSLSLCQEDGDWILKSQPGDKFLAPFVANGMIGIVPSEKPLSIDKVMLNGVFDVYGRGDGVSNIVQGINFMNLDIATKDGARLSNTNSSQIKILYQQINLKESILSTKFRLWDRLDIQYDIISLRQLPFNSLINIEIKVFGDEELCISNRITGGEGLKIGKKESSRINNIHLTTVHAETPTGRHKVVNTNAFKFQSGTSGIQIDDKDENVSVFNIKMQKDESFKFSLISAQCSDVQIHDPYNESKRLVLYAFLEGIERLMERHLHEWSQLWDNGDIIIEGNPEDQINIRYMLFNLYSCVREGADYGLSPMGLSGNGYNGHSFWDTEIWMFPALLVLQPQIAKTLIDYRLKCFKEAKQNAFIRGYKGAMFPLESAEFGSEETPVWALTGLFEHHTTADIGIAFWNYFLVTHDLLWLKNEGFPVLKEVADFWVSRTRLNEKGEYEIHNVICVDEYAENVDNNAYTNAAAIVALKNAVGAANILKIKANPLWIKVANNIPVRKFENGVIKEHETYNGQTIKQADVDLLAFPLKYITDENTIRKNMEYYSQKVDKVRGPAMTYSIYSIIANRLGDCEKAYTYFNDGYKPNQRAPFGVLAECRTCNNPYFLTAAGGALQAVIFGFGGIEITNEGIVQVKSCLPKSWKSLTIKGAGVENKIYRNKH
jgi:trehalose/maltose hydrolase-like predicted phosphorylase